MVHALKEIWRVLVDGGCVIDLRPLATGSPVEVMAGRQLYCAGQVDESGDVPNTVASDNALLQLEQAGYFVCERKELFEYANYWDTPDEMKAYAEENWTNSRLPAEVWAEAHRLMADSDKRETAKVRIRYRMVIARYRKLLPVTDEKLKLKY